MTGWQVIVIAIMQLIVGGALGYSIGYISACKEKSARKPQQLALTPEMLDALYSAYLPPAQGQAKPQKVCRGFGE